MHFCSKVDRRNKTVFFVFYIKNIKFINLLILDLFG